MLAILKHKSPINWQDLHWRGPDGYVHWLHANVGHYLIDWDYDDHFFYFDNEGDAIMFTLRWS